MRTTHIVSVSFQDLPEYPHQLLVGGDAAGVGHCDRGIALLGEGGEEGGLEGIDRDRVRGVEGVQDEGNQDALGRLRMMLARCMRMYAAPCRWIGLTSAGGSCCSSKGRRTSSASWNLAIGWTICAKACAAVEHGSVYARWRRWPTLARTGSMELIPPRIGSIAELIDARIGSTDPRRESMPLPRAPMPPPRGPKPVPRGLMPPRMGSMPPMDEEVPG